MRGDADSRRVEAVDTVSPGVSAAVPLEVYNALRFGLPPATLLAFVKRVALVAGAGAAWMWVGGQFVGSPQPTVAG